MAMFPDKMLKNDSGARYTRALFYELTRIDDKEVALFTLTETPKHGLISFPSLYRLLTEDDPTEYTFAIEVFGEWDHWLRIASTRGVKEVVDFLRDENIVRQKSKAIRLLAQEVKENGKNSFAAAKLLMDKGWIDKDAAPRGRPSRKKQEAAEDAAVADLLKDDAERLGLNLSGKMN